MKLKRVFSLLLVLCLLAGLVPVSASAASGSCGSNVTWSLSGGTLTISGSGAMTDYGEEAPPWLDYYEDITKIVVNGGVTSIGDYAFYFLYNATSVSIPSSVTNIGEYAFTYCISLTDVEIPSKVTKIEEGAFLSCYSLESVTLKAGLKTIGKLAFAVTALQTVYIPSTVTTIEPAAFAEAFSLSKFSVSSDNTSFKTKNGVLLSKDGTRLVQYPLGKSATSYTVPSSVTKIDAYAFEASSLETVKLNSGLKTIGDYAFAYSNLESITIPASVTSIGDQALGNCYYLTSIKVNSDNTKYSSSNGVLFNKSKTRLITYPQGKTTGTYTIPSTVTKIADYAFCGNAYLTKVLIPAGIKSIGDFSFADCYELKTMVFLGRAPEFGEGCFAYDEMDVYYPKGNSTWKSSLRKSYDGNDVTWHSYKELAVTEQPTAQKVKAGTDATFTVKADGSNKKYQWQYRTSSDDTWKNTAVSGSKTATLTIAATTAKNGYQFRCKITDVTGSVTYSDTATLYVLGVTSNPKTQKVEAGSKATFSVKATGHKKTYQWQYRTSSDGTWKNTTATGNKTNKLTVSATTAKSSYQYRCKITDSAGNVTYSNPATLYVLGVTSQPKDVTAASGEDAVFTVKATGHKKTYQWQYRTSADGTWKNTAVDGSDTNKLTISVRNSKDGYQFRCKITDSAGNVTYSDAATLTVE